MAITFLDARRLVRRMTGNRLDDPRAGDAIQYTLRRLYRWGWSWKLTESILVTVAPYTTGTVSAGTAPNLVQGSGTGWTAALVGRELRVAQDVGFYKVIAIDVVNQVLTLESPYAGVLTPGVSYVLTQRIYSLAADIDAETSLSYWQKIPESTQQELDRLDARRTFSSTFPFRFIHKGLDANGVLQIEIYPVPASALPIRYSYLAKAPTLVQGRDDSVLLKPPEEVLSHLAAADGLRSYVAEHPELPGVQTLREMAREYEELGRGFEKEAQFADLKVASASPAVHEDDSQLLVSDEIALAHDVYW